MTTGRVLRVLGGHRVPVDKINLLTDGRSAWSRTDALTSHGMAPELKLWDIKTGRVICDVAARDQVVFSADGKSALGWRPAANGESTVETWNLIAGEKLKELTVPGSVHAIALSPDGRTALVGKDRELSLFDLERRG